MIDKEVAEKILGWRVVYFDRFYYSPDAGWSQDGPYDTQDECKHAPVAYWQEPNGASVHEVEEFPFARSLDAVCLVEDEIERRGIGVAYIRALIDITWAGIDSYDQDGRYEGAFALLRATPEQRCRAALQVVG